LNRFVRDFEGGRPDLSRYARVTLEFVSNRKRLLEEALTLPAEERAALAGALIESLDAAVDEDVEAAWSEEIRRRLERVDAGLAKTVPWSEARRRILAAADRGSNA
jgi:putative addiction module component (TIGR02574 family)